jgi:hypothetical protein
MGATLSEGVPAGAKARRVKGWARISESGFPARCYIGGIVARLYGHHPASLGQRRRFVLAQAHTHCKFFTPTGKLASIFVAPTIAAAIEFSMA